MASEALRELTDRQPTAQDFAALHTELYGPGSDRGIAILGANLLDNALKFTLISRIKPKRDKEVNKIFGDHRQLHTLELKIIMVYNLDVLGDKTRSNLEAVTKVRNVFAHAVSPISFDSTAIAEVCKGLKLSQNLLPFLSTDFKTPKERYVGICDVISTILVDLSVTNEGGEWPAPLP